MADGYVQNFHGRKRWTLVRRLLLYLVYTNFFSRFAGDLLVRPVRFTRNVSIVSVSMDGVSMPQLYVLGAFSSRLFTCLMLTPQMTYRK